MCGIVGLFLKDPALKADLGLLLTDMLVTMSDRGPDSAGVAIYHDEEQNQAKLTLQSDNPEQDFLELARSLKTEFDVSLSIDRKDSHAILRVPKQHLNNVRSFIKRCHSGLRIMSVGDCIEIYKEVGMPLTVAQRFELPEMHGTHGIGHTRMATESAITTLGAHPFNTGPDQCLVHNGSLSNHNSLRRHLQLEGIHIETENDTEVGAAYLTWKMQNGSSLGEALQSSLNDLDGFFTFVVGTKDGFGVLRDPIACKPAVLAETDQYVAFGSEYRALVNLPKIAEAHIWEPEPATVYFWTH
mgnify:CR=1 FL=1